MAEIYSSVTDKLAHGVADVLGTHRPKYSKWGFELLKKDPVLEAFRSWGYKVVEYDLEPYPLRLAAIIAIRMGSMIVVSSIVAYFLYHYVSPKSRVLHWACIGGLITTLMAWPLVTGMSGVMLLDFWRPALGFRSSMLVWDIWNIRTREEVNSWNFFRFLAHLWAFPKEEDEIEERTQREGYARNARIENLKGYPKVLFEFVALLLTLYFIPPFELTRGMSQLAYHCYCDMLGLSILMALALFGDGLLKGIGIIINVEMQDMFENPLGTTNIRLFWSHWNRAIATVLHRVVFGGGKRKGKSSVSRKPSKSRADQSARKEHLDHLSETEAEHSNKSEDEDSGSSRARASGLRPLTKADGNGQVTNRKNAFNGSAASKSGSSKSSNKSKGSFLPKATAAMATFIMSGIFHEHITYFTLGFANGENILFFGANGVATVVSTWFKRTFPEINARIPTLVSVLMLHAFFLAVIPLFCSPFIRSGFFTQLDAFKYELLPVDVRKRGSFIYLFGN